MSTLRQLLHRQDLVVTRAQALGRGMSHHAWDWRVGRTWQRVIEGVAVAHTGPLTDDQRRWAAVLHAGTGARLDGDTALALLGLPVDTVPIVVSIPHARRVKEVSLADGTPLTLKRVRGLDQLGAPSTGLPVVSRHVAVLHAAGWAATDRAAEWRIAAMVQRRLSAPPLLRGALEQLPRLPRRRLLLTVLDDVELGAHAASELEFLRFLRRNGLPLPDERQLKLRAGGRTSYLDARYRKQRVTFEIDGSHHQEAGQWEADVLRALRLTVSLEGERVVRLTPGAMRHDGPEVAELLRKLLLPPVRGTTTRC